MSPHLHLKVFTYLLNGDLDGTCEKELVPSRWEIEIISLSKYRWANAQHYFSNAGVPHVHDQ